MRHFTVPTGFPSMAAMSSIEYSPLAASISGSRSRGVSDLTAHAHRPRELLVQQLLFARRLRATAGQRPAFLVAAPAAPQRARPPTVAPGLRRRDIACRHAIVSTHVRNDASPAEPGQAAPRRHERVLRDVFRLLSIAERRGGRPHHRRAVPLDEFAEGRLVVAPRAFDEVCVGHLAQ